MKPEIPLFIAVLIAANLGWVFGAGPSAALTFNPNAWSAGAWWQPFTHAFVHLNAYHFALDALTFLVLYQMLECREVAGRLLYLVAAGAGSLLGACLGPLALSEIGYCGLSGIGHGLMAITACEMMRDRGFIRKTGMVTLGLVVGKSVLEVLTGQVFLHSWHVGDVGTPVVSGHLGGVIGGLVMFALVHVKRIPAWQEARA